MLLAALSLLQISTGSRAVFQSPRLRESSGVAVSRSYPGVLWTHNDSGDGPYLYATDLSGHDRGFMLVAGAHAIDWEDMALGPCPARLRATQCVYIADTGDNLESRDFVTLYAVPEPAPPQAPGDTLRTTRAPAVLRLRYPDGSHDVEAMYVSPRDSASYLVSKGRSGAIRVYRVAMTAWSRVEDATATAIQTLDITPNLEAGRVITGAAIRTDGRVVVLRTYSELYLFYSGIGGHLTPARERPCSVAGLEIGGEAIDFLNDTTFVLTSEAGRRHAGTILTVICPL